MAKKPAKRAPAKKRAKPRVAARTPRRVMSKTGKRLIGAAIEAGAIARGENDALAQDRAENESAMIDRERDRAARTRRIDNLAIVGIGLALIAFALTIVLHLPLPR